MAIKDLKPIENGQNSITDRVFQSIFRAIAALGLPPATKMSEAEIAEVLNVSRQPVRDAFFRLSKIGLLDIQPQRATQVTKITFSAVSDALMVRIALEVETLRLTLTKATTTDIAALELNLRDQEQALKVSDPEVFHNLHNALHQQLFEISGHPNAWQIIEEQSAHIERVLHLALTVKRREQLLQEHKEIVDAISQRDLQKAEGVLRAHLLAAKSFLPEVHSRFPEYFGTPA